MTLENFVWKYTQEQVYTTRQVRKSLIEKFITLDLIIRHKLYYDNCNIQYTIKG